MACEIIGSSLFDRYIEKENPLIIDLRSEKDYVLLKKNKIILLYCSRGAQSYFMCRKMSMAGFNVKSLAGGIERYKGRYITA